MLTIYEDQALYRKWLRSIGVNLESEINMGTLFVNDLQEYWGDIFPQVWALAQVGIDLRVLPFVDERIRNLYLCLRMLWQNPDTPIDSDQFLAYMLTREDLCVIAFIAYRHNVEISIAKGNITYVA